MKRLSVLVVALILVMLIANAFSESIDLSGMKLAELISLKNQVDSILFESGELYVGEPIPCGEYTAGKNIKPGKYEITCLGDEPEYHRPYLSVYDVNWKCVSSDSFQIGSYLIADIKEGESFSIGLGTFAIKPATIYSWMMD